MNALDPLRISYECVIPSKCKQKATEGFFPVAEYMVEIKDLYSRRSEQNPRVAESVGGSECGECDIPCRASKRTGLLS